MWGDVRAPLTNERIQPQRGERGAPHGVNTGGTITRFVVMAGSVGLVFENFPRRSPGGQVPLTPPTDWHSKMLCMHRQRRWALGCCALVLALAPVSGCSNDSKAGTVATAESTAPPTTDPTDTDSGAGFKLTNDIIIKDGSVVPKQAMAEVIKELVFKNETAVPQEVRFTNVAKDDPNQGTGVIAPGGEVRISQSTPVSLTFEVVTQPGVTGAIQVQNVE